VIAVRTRVSWIFIFIQVMALDMLGHDRAPLSLEIYVYNQAEVPRAILLRAERRVTLILRDSGVQPEWLDCIPLPGAASPCSGPAHPGSVAVQIVHGTTKMRDEIFGAAFLDEDGTGSQTDVFYDRLDELHRDWNISLPELLGNVIAHEIGHLLLGLHAHSPGGIMRPVWSPAELLLAERVASFFSADQSKLIRQRLERRVRMSESARNGD
jgi:hypothetical protein